jgi:hypothetical protein
MNKGIAKLFFSLLLFFSQSIDAQNYYGSGNVIMPVELVYFEAEILDSLILLKWGTASEVNNYGFDIERADMQYNWETLGFIDGQGNSNIPHDYTFEDTSAIKNHSYYYRLKQIDTDGTFDYSDTIFVDFITAVLELSEIPVNEYRLYNNYPNPFNNNTIIKFSISENTPVSLRIFDILGKEIAVLLEEEKSIGVYSIPFTAPDLTSGVYFYQLVTRNYKESKKFVLIK